MRRKGDSKVLENQVKMQQNSHLHGADNPTYLKSGSDKVSAPRSESQSLSISLSYSSYNTSTPSYTHSDGYRCHLLFCWSYIFGNRKGYVQHVLWYQQGIRCVIILFLKIYITRYRFLKPHRKNRRTTNPCIYLTKRHTHTHEIKHPSPWVLRRETKERSDLRVAGKYDNPCTFEKTEPPQNPRKHPVQ